MSDRDLEKESLKGGGDLGQLEAKSGPPWLRDGALTRAFDIPPPDI